MITFLIGITVGIALVVAALLIVGFMDDYEYYRKRKHGKMRALHLTTKDTFLKIKHLF